MSLHIQWRNHRKLRWSDSIAGDDVIVSSVVRDDAVRESTVVKRLTSRWRHQRHCAWLVRWKWRRQSYGAPAAVSLWLNIGEARLTWRQRAIGQCLGTVLARRVGRARTAFVVDCAARASDVVPPTCRQGPRLTRPKRSCFVFGHGGDGGVLVVARVSSVRCRLCSRSSVGCTSSRRDRSAKEDTLIEYRVQLLCRSACWDQFDGDEPCRRISCRSRAAVELAT